MTEGFDAGAERALALAREESLALKHNLVGSEHVLLGLLEEGGAAAGVLRELGFTPEGVRAEIVRVVGQGTEVPAGDVPFTPNARRALDAARREAAAVGQPSVATEHLLLGLLHVHESVAAGILTGPGLSLSLIDVRAGVVREHAASEQGVDEVEMRPLSAPAAQVLRHAHDAAVSAGSDEIEPDHLRQGLQALDM